MNTSPTLFYRIPLPVQKMNEIVREIDNPVKSTYKIPAGKYVISPGMYIISENKHRPAGNMYILFENKPRIFGNTHRIFGIRYMFCN